MTTHIYLNPSFVEGLYKIPSGEAALVRNPGEVAYSRTLIQKVVGVDSGNPYIGIRESPIDPAFWVDPVVTDEAIDRVTFKGRYNELGVFRTGLYVYGDEPNEVYGQVEMRIHDNLIYLEISVSGPSVEALQPFLIELYAGELEPTVPWDVKVG